jgi:class 3 adenylate cyclase
MTAHGVEKIKTIGDAYMAAGGLPLPSPDSAYQTVLAALEMQAFLMARKAERTAAGMAGFEMRVGIHTGPVVAGIVGVKKFQYDIWGDTVNTASRMESSGEIGQVNISGNTYRILKDRQDLRFSARGRIEAKGKGEMEMYFVSLAHASDHDGTTRVMPQQEGKVAEGRT